MPSPRLRERQHRGFSDSNEDLAAVDPLSLRLRIRSESTGGYRLSGKDLRMLLACLLRVARHHNSADDLMGSGHPAYCLSLRLLACDSHSNGVCEGALMKYSIAG